MTNPVQTRQVTNIGVAREVEAIKAFDPGLGAFHFDNLGQAVQFSDLMARAGEMIPAFMRERPALCLAITMRAVHWGFDPFALAQEAYQAQQGGPVGYQAKVFTAVLRKAGVHLRYRYEGTVTMSKEPARSAKGNQVAPRTASGDRRCIASVVIDGDEIAYETPPLDDIGVKNSPLWHNDPDQQLAYFAGRAWTRRYRPDLIMGAYSADEVADDARTIRDVTPAQEDVPAPVSGFARVAKRGLDAVRDAPNADDPGVDADQIPEDDTQDIPDDAAKSPELDQAYDLGRAAAQEGIFTEQDCPFTDQPNYRDAWVAGFRSIDMST